MELGKYAQSEAVVGTDNTAISVGSGNLPVFATPFMIALMENAAMKCVAPCLDETSATVGVAINVEHTRASKTGEKIIAKATLTAINGRELLFDVEACDNKGQIGRGTHKRFIVDIEKFMNKLT
ncbi:MAG: thioesterase family protein [Prevotellaceae bacterium]|nr:thioesterase family protein [Prevotellaceae bacterium]